MAFIKSKKRRVLTAFSLAMINVIAIDSLRNLPIDATYGFGIIAFYIIGAVLFLLPCILVTAELATNAPETGGTYVWVRDAFGPRWGFMTSWLLWIYNVIWFPTILSFIVTTITYLFNPALANNKPFMVASIIIVFLLATWINTRGVRSAAALSTVGAIIGTIVPMLFITALGVIWFVGGHPLAIQPNWTAFMPNLSNPDHLAFFVVILFSLFGMEMSAVHAGDVRNPKKDFPRALIISSIIILTTMILAALAIAIVIPHNQIGVIAGINQAFGVFLSAYHLKCLIWVALIMIIVGAFAGMGAWVMGPARAMAVAAEDGCAPKWFAKQNANGGPTNMLWLQAGIVLVIALLILTVQSFNASYWILSDMSSQLAMLYYILFFAAAIGLRYRREPKADAYKIPGGKLGVWLVCGVGIVTCLVVTALGFIPPTQIGQLNVTQYEAWLVGGILLFALLPWVIYRFARR